mgnify:FL=1|jgi:hypothetical protein
MYIQIKLKSCTTSVIAVVSVKEKDLNEVEIKFKDKEALKLARLNLSNVGLTVSERAFRRMRIKGYKQLLIK